MRLPPKHHVKVWHFDLRNMKLRDLGNYSGAMDSWNHSPAGEWDLVYVPDQYRVMKDYHGMSWVFYRVEPKDTVHQREP